MTLYAMLAGGEQQDCSVEWGLWCFCTGISSTQSSLWSFFIKNPLSSHPFLFVYCKQIFVLSIFPEFIWGGGVGVNTHVWPAILSTLCIRNTFIFHLKRFPLSIRQVCWEMHWSTSKEDDTNTAARFSWTLLFLLQCHAFLFTVTCWEPCIRYCNHYN